MTDNQKESLVNDSAELRKSAFALAALVVKSKLENGEILVYSIELMKTVSELEHSIKKEAGRI